MSGRSSEAVGVVITSALDRFGGHYAAPAIAKVRR
jgi:hypothetical protein